MPQTHIRTTTILKQINTLEKIINTNETVMQTKPYSGLEALNILKTMLNLNQPTKEQKPMSKDLTGKHFTISRKIAGYLPDGGADAETYTLEKGETINEYIDDYKYFIETTQDKKITDNEIVIDWTGETK